MSDVLDRICADKRRHIAAQQAKVPLSALQEKIAKASPPRGFLERLRASVRGGHDGLIAELKKASPSKGLIRDDFDPANLARAYEAGGATCLSVLTDAPYFQGADEYLMQARNAVQLPVLRKDFMLDPYQVHEARAIGADCILLIMAALSDAQASELEAAARELDMDVLVEVHDRPELDRALALKSRLIGINNRNLKTLEVDLRTAEALATHLPAAATGVCESGLRGPEELARMRRAGLHCFLIGESLMRQNDVTAATQAILRRTGAAAQ